MSKWQSLNQEAQEQMKQVLVYAVREALDDIREAVAIARKRNTLGGIGDHVWEAVSEVVRNNAQSVVGAADADDIVEEMYDMFWDIFDKEAESTGG